jgi:hypothetical protein
MRFIIMHKTNPHWESGAIPSPELIARVGGFLGELSKTGRLDSAAGLRASAEGVRLQFHQGERTVIAGPFAGNNELPAGFTILRAHSLDDAIEWATRQAQIVGDVEIDIRPVTEPWDIGMQPRPAELTTRRYMILRKATGATESGAAPTPSTRTQLTTLIEATLEAGGDVFSETMRPSRRGRRYKNSRNGVTVMDGPFVETKELLAGYVIVSASSLDEAGHCAMKYLDVVGADEVDVRELE